MNEVDLCLRMGDRLLTTLGDRCAGVESSTLTVVKDGMGGRV